MDYTRARHRMVKTLKEAGAIKREIVENAFLAVPREKFIPPKYKEYAYNNMPVPLGYDSTISQPTAIANIIEAAEISKGDKVLEVGSGSGYLLALLSNIVGLSGQVNGIEIVPQLAEISIANLKEYSNINVSTGDGWYGLKDKSPFTKIIISAAAKKKPERLFKQLSEGGSLIVPINYLLSQKLLLIRKEKGGNLVEKSLGLYSFVPLKSR